jgi:hypothetical protein
MPFIASRLRGLIAPTAADEPVRLADETGGGTGGTGTGSGPPLSADTHPASPTSWDDEFEASTISSAWTTGLASGGATVVLEGGSIVKTLGGNGPRVLYQAVPSGSWEFTAKIAMPLVSGVNGASPALGCFNMSSGNAIAIGRYVGDGDIYIQKGSYNTSTWVYTTGSNANHGLNLYLPGLAGWAYVRLSYDSTAGQYHSFVSATGLPHSFAPFFDEAVSTFLVSITHIQLVFDTISAANINGAACDWFRRTA